MTISFCFAQHLLQCWDLLPAFEQVLGTSTVNSFSKSCPSAGMTVCGMRVALQTEQWLPAVSPLCTQVAGTAGSATSLWPSAVSV